MDSEIVTKALDIEAAVEETAASVASMSWSDILASLANWAVTTGVKIVIALLIMFISFKLINKLARTVIKKNENNGKLDKTIVKTLTYIGKIAAKVIITICLIGYLGIDTSGLTALVASFGVCFGLAVNGALSNIAGGILILVARPFKVDDFIEVAGTTGTVEDIRMVSTKIVTLDNRVVYVPNSTASSSTVINYSEKDLRRVDLEFSVSYKCDFRKAEQIILDVISANEKALKDPAPFVRMIGHGDSAVKIVTRTWVNSPDYWDVYFALLEDIKTAFDENGIEIPFQQLDVHVRNN